MNSQSRLLTFWQNYSWPGLLFLQGAVLFLIIAVATILYYRPPQEIAFNTPAFHASTLANVTQWQELSRQSIPVRFPQSKKQASAFLLGNLYGEWVAFCLAGRLDLVNDHTQWIMDSPQLSSFIKDKMGKLITLKANPENKALMLTALLDIERNLESELKTNHGDLELRWLQFGLWIAEMDYAVFGQSQYLLSQYRLPLSKRALFFQKLLAGPYPDLFKQLNHMNATFLAPTLGETELKHLRQTTQEIQQYLFTLPTTNSLKTVF